MLPNPPWDCGGCLLSATPALALLQPPQAKKEQQHVLKFPEAVRYPSWRACLAILAQASMLRRGPATWLVIFE